MQKIFSKKTIFLSILFFSFFALAKSSQAVYPVAGSKRFSLFGFFFAFFLTCTGFALASPAYGADLYVATTGNDNNNGSINTPFKTIQKAANIVNPGDTVIVKDGTYTDSVDVGGGLNAIVSFTRGGNATNWVTFKAENPGGAVLDGLHPNTTKYAMLFTGNASYIGIENFEIKRCKAGIWNQEMDYLYFYRNNIHDMGRLCGGGHDDGGGAAYMGTGSTYITWDSNLIHHNGRYYCGEVGPEAPSGCYKDYCGTLDPGLYLTGSNMDIINNIFYENNSSPHMNIKGAYCPTCGDHFRVINNTFGQNKFKYEGVLELTSADSGQSGTVEDILIENNLFLSSNGWAIICWTNSAMCGNSTELKNIVIKNNMTNSETLIYPYFGNPYTNPSFTIQDNYEKVNAGYTAFVNNYEGYDFRLKAGSPAINAGLNTNAPALDYAGIARGNPPDIGAYEYISGGDTTPPSAPGGLAVQ